jgi:hypothetical protein
VVQPNGVDTVAVAGLPVVSTRRSVNPGLSVGAVPVACGLPVAFTVCTWTCRAGSTVSSEWVGGSGPGWVSVTVASNGVENSLPRATRSASRQSPVLETRA